LQSKYVDVVAELRPGDNRYLRVWLSSEQEDLLRKTIQMPFVTEFWYRHTEYGMIEPLWSKKTARKAVVMDEREI
jgi:hypothetical protein